MSDIISSYLKKVRKAESGNNDKAVNPMGGASGRYQFVKSTWEELGYDWKDRFNPELQEEAMTKFTQANVDQFVKATGKQPTEADLYGLHFLGAKGYINAVKSGDDTPITNIVSKKAYQYNKPVMEKDGRPITVGELKGWLSKKMNSTPSEGQGYFNNQYQDYKVDATLPTGQALTFNGEAEEPKKSEEETAAENLNTKSFLKDYEEIFAQQQAVTQQQIPQQQTYQQFAPIEVPQVSPIEYTPIMQNGGEIIKDNNGYWNPDNWGKVVEISSPQITMEGVSQPLWGVSKETGETRLMTPNSKHFFKDTKSVIEYPIFQKGGEAETVQIDRGDGKLENININSQEYKDLYNSGLVFGVQGDTLLNNRDLEAVTITGFRKTKPESLEEKIDTSKFNFEEINNKKYQELVAQEPLLKIDKKEVELEKKATEEKDKKVEELVNKRKQEISKKRTDLDVVEEEFKPIDINSLKTKDDIKRVQERLSIEGYNLNPEGKFKNNGIDGIAGKITIEALNDYNNSGNRNQYTSFKDKQGFLGYCKEGQCSEYVQNENFRNLKPNVPRQQFNELTGLYGDAWRIGDNIEKAGGQKVTDKNVKPGDIITLFTGGSSPYLSEAKKFGTDATHTAIIDKVNPDGSYYILHNVHEIDYKGRLTGEGDWKGREYRNLVKDGKIVDDTNTGFTVRGVYRANYDKVKDFEKKVKVRKDVKLLPNNNFDKIVKAFESKNYVGDSTTEKVNIYLNTLNNYDTKTKIAKKHGLSEDDYQSLSKVALGILAQESKFGTSDSASVKQPVATMLSAVGFKEDEASKGAGRIKYKTNYGNQDLTELGINEENFQEDSSIPLVVLDLIANNYKYYLKKGESKKNAMYKAIEKYNKGRSTKYSEDKDVDYANKVLNYTEAFSVKKGNEEFKTTSEDLLEDKKVNRKYFDMF